MLAGCAGERAAVDLSLAPPEASAFVVHGNCFVDWFIGSRITVAETHGVDTVIESLSFRVEDATGALIGQSTMDAEALLVNFPGSGTALPAHTARTFDMGVGTGGPLVRPPLAVVMIADVVVADSDGRVGTSSRAPGTVTFPDVHLGASGPCPPN
jgi:hypothetical protein